MVSYGDHGGPKPTTDTMTSLTTRSPRSSSNSHTTTPSILSFSAHQHPLPSPSSYIRTNSVLIQSDDGRGINKQQQYPFNFNDATSPYSTTSYTFPEYYNNHRRKKRSYLKPILATLTIIAILIYLLISEKFQLSWFTLASSSGRKVPKPNNVVGDSSYSNITMINITTAATITGFEDVVDVDDDFDELRGWEDDDTISNATSTTQVIDEDMPIIGGDGNSTIDYMNALFDNETMHISSVDHNISATDDREPMS